MTALNGKFVKVVSEAKYPRPKDLVLVDGDVLKIVDSFNRLDFDCVGVTKVEHKGIIYNISELNSSFWSFFTDTMIGDERLRDWGLRFATEEEYAATIPVAPLEETEYLMQGKNGERLIESVSDIKSRIAAGALKLSPETVNGETFEMRMQRLLGAAKVGEGLKEGEIMVNGIVVDTKGISKVQTGSQSFILTPEGVDEQFAKESAERMFNLGVGKFSTPTEPVIHTNNPEVLEKFEEYKKSVGLDTKSLQEKYDEWVIENIHVYELFKKFTLQAIAAGKKKISHWLIVNRLRWEMEIETKALTDDERQYKISNDYIAFLARDFIKDHPEHADIFNLKQMKRV